MAVEPERVFHQRNVKLVDSLFISHGPLTSCIVAAPRVVPCPFLPGFDGWYHNQSVASPGDIANAFNELFLMRFAVRGVLVSPQRRKPFNWFKADVRNRGQHRLLQNDVRDQFSRDLQRRMPQYTWPGHSLLQWREQLIRHELYSYIRNHHSRS